MDVMEKTSNENRLIDVNDIYSLFNQNGMAILHVSDIDKIPRLDAVEIVRCKYCTWYENGKDYEPYCNHPTHGIPYPCDYDFCSYVERKEGAD